jgi:hypothetical protein
MRKEFRLSLFCSLHSEHQIDALGVLYSPFFVCSSTPGPRKIIIENGGQLPNDLFGNFFGIGIC